MASKNKKKVHHDLSIVLQIIILSILLSLVWAMLIGKIFDRYVPAETPLPIVILQKERREPIPTPTSFTEISHGDHSKKQVIFTFDAGSGQGSAREILAALAKHKVKGSFFLVGRWVEENPDLTRQMVADGHEIFNHSYSHPYYTKLSAEEIQKDLTKMDDILYTTAGVRTKPYFRPPYGDRNAASNAAAAAIGYRSIYWSIDTLDWREGETKEAVKARIYNNLHNGAIILMHVGTTVTGEVLDEIFTKLEADGYKLVSLTEGL